jgi:hypothetical protein
MDVRKVWLRCMDWIDLAQNRDQWRALVNTVMNLRVPKNIRKFLSSCTTGGLSREGFRSTGLVSQLVYRLCGLVVRVPGYRSRGPDFLRSSGSGTGSTQPREYNWGATWICGLSGQSSWLQIQRSGFDSPRYQIFWEVVGLERGPLRLMSTIEELLGRKSSGSGLESREYGRVALTTWHPLSAKVDTNVADKHKIFVNG